MREPCPPTVSVYSYIDWPIFALQDTTALIIQSVGGAIASGTQPDLGGHIALSGIVLQLGMVTRHHTCHF
jgi:hypothetical protein